MTEGVRVWDQEATLSLLQCGHVNLLSPRSYIERHPETRSYPTSVHGVVAVTFPNSQLMLLHPLGITLPFSSAEISSVSKEMQPVFPML